MKRMIALLERFIWLPAPSVPQKPDPPAGKGGL